MSKTKTEVTESPVAPDPAAAAPEPGKHDERIDSWFAKHFHNLGPLLETRIYNILQAAKEDLKAELRKL